MKVQDKIQSYELSYSGGKEMVKTNSLREYFTKIEKVVYSNMYKIIHMQRLKYGGKVYWEV